jgi:maleate isomerase
METWQKEVGFITPPGSGIMMPEFLAIRPAGVGFRQTILYLDDKTGQLTEQERIDRMISELQRAVKILDICEVGVITQSGMPFIFTKGAGFEDELRNDLQRLTKIPVVFQASAFTEALRTLNARRLAIATYYSDNFNSLLKKFLEDNGITVSNIQGLPETSSLKPPSVKYAQITPERVLAFSKEVARKSRDADTLAILGGGIWSIGIIKRLEDELNLSVTSANQAMFWKAFKVLGVREDLTRFGKLMEKLY